jgi:hypothetical protein
MSAQSPVQPPVQSPAPAGARRSPSVTSSRSTASPADHLATGLSAGAPRSRCAPIPAPGGPSARLCVQASAAQVLVDLPMAARIEADIAQLNLSFLHVARELARSARELAVTRLGLDAAACAALDRLSLADLEALAHSHALIFGLRVDATHLPMQAELARTNQIASGARLLLANDAR